MNDPFSKLKTAVWVYDIDNFCISWANEKALELWEADSPEELRTRDFKVGSSDAVRSSLLDYQQAFRRGETRGEFWTFTPKDIVKKALLIMSGHVLKDGRMAMLCEALTLDLIPDMELVGSTVMMSSYQLDGTFISANPPFKEDIGSEDIRLDELIVMGSKLAQIYTSLESSGQFKGDVLCRRQGMEVWYHLDATLSSQDGMKKILIHQYNIHNRKLQERAFEKDSHTDLLTGLLNRRGLFDRLQSYRDEKKHFAIFYLDLDGFKMINDSFGHACGDQVLKSVSARLSATLFSKGHACRFGGDEFIWTCGLDELPLPIDVLSDKLLNAVSHTFYGEFGVPMDVAASVGSAIYPQDGITTQEIISCADAAMYMAKRTGKRRAVCYRPGMEKENKRLGILAQNLSQAIKNRELSLHYQPIYHVGTNKIDSYEALIRWQCESLGYISADETIRIAESTGLIHSIENWVIRQALQDLKEFREGSDDSIRMSINISGLHLAQADFVSSLEEKIIQAGLKPQDVIVELTETALLDGIDDEDSNVNQLHKLGVGISIDDFGTGYSSLAYLHKIPADVVKIDKSFVEQVGKDSRTIDYIHRLISSLGKTTLVEGVETQEQKEIVQALGINLHQGYWFSRPQSLMFFKSQPISPRVIEIG
ncbi:hypothetical protein OA92_17465 [Marinomonas sp. SBI22]|uniref:putative bifunctional diguanylate cyclase/phosphodiesterase n=1 Tax=unclassified Marinomonas TaxID=196814 RepID=UPI0007AFC52C|nr:MULTISPECIES: EAL domain-containing protein [unclassified Marinomonas]KZM40328.1 hypothetical protein OA92_17465 [Marinomonas sp. SBI22]KZM41745.1 hypothetical protein OA91_16700 [Marinomonas sp. SBI8L]